jgi:MoxR-like ATPase
MSYTPIFDSNAQRKARGTPPADLQPYHYSEALELAVNVALAARRPLLLRGNPGTGKSSLAADVAWCLGWRYEVEVITSHTQAQDLKWRFDAVRRLSEVQAGTYARDRPQLERDRPFVEPGVLWRAFEPPAAPSDKAQAASGVVVLLDEIDKAEPDVPNDLLVTLDERWFKVPELGQSIKAPPELRILMIITTNNERDLPSAFLRRCVVFEIPPHDREQLERIARLHHPQISASLLQSVLKTFDELVEDAKKQRLRPPSTAELLDAIRACRGLEIDGGFPHWEQILRAALWKH